MTRDIPLPGQESQQWLDEARLGSTEAFGGLFTSLQPGLLQIAEADEEQRLRTKADAEDLVQQVFLEAFRDWSQFRGETPGALLAWLRQILRHKLSDLSRRFHTQKQDVRREVPFAEPHSGEVCTPPRMAENESSGEGHSRGEPSAMVERILARLPEDYRMVIVLRIREGRSFAAIAGLMHRSPAAVRKLFSRAVAKARQSLERHT